MNLSTERFLSKLQTVQAKPPEKSRDISTPPSACAGQSSHQLRQTWALGQIRSSFEGNEKDDNVCGHLCSDTRRSRSRRRHRGCNNCLKMIWAVKTAQGCRKRTVMTARTRQRGSNPPNSSATRHDSEEVRIPSETKQVNLSSLSRAASETTERSRHIPSHWKRKDH